MTGRARTRARGRARGVLPKGDDDDVRRPGPDEEAAIAASRALAAAAPPGQPPPPNPIPVIHSGRATHRGGTKNDSRPGEPDEMAAQMAAMHIAGCETSVADKRKQLAERYGAPLQMRPAHITSSEGEVGDPCMIYTNYFKFDGNTNWNLYQYRVDFQPTIQSVRLRGGLINEHRELLGAVRCFDGDTLYLPKYLGQEVTDLDYQLRNGEKGKIRIKKTNILAPTSSQCLHVYNVIFKRLLKILDMKEFNRNYYMPQHRIMIPQHNLEVWPGFVTSILQYESGVMLNCDVSFKILHKTTVLDRLYDIYRSVPNNQFHEAAKSALVGQIVLTRYNNKTYRIDDIDFDQTPESTFDRKGNPVSFKDYMMEQYELQVTDFTQPMLLSLPKDKEKKKGRPVDGPPKPALLIPEFCTLTGIPDEMRANFATMKDISQHTRLGPDARYSQISQFIKSINQNEACQRELSGWGLAFSQDVVNLRGRKLPVEKIQMNNSEFFYRASEADWSREMRDKQMLTSVPLTNWIVICGNRQSQVAWELVQNLAKVARPLGMQINHPQTHSLERGETSEFVHALKNLITPETQMVLCVLPNDRKDRYDSIKKICCVENAVPSQCVLNRTLSKQKGLMSVATKIAIQMNCKLGGDVWAVTIPLKGMMVCGIDSYHNAGRRGGSVCGFVATMNRHCTQYFSKVCFQHNHGELVDGLRTCMQAALKQYHQVNGVLPEKICIYRDGVGDGQLYSVYNYEMAEILKTFKLEGQTYDPAVTMIVCKKRVSARFFVEFGRNLGNPEPGTIIDTKVTRPEWFDFYQVSQKVNQGTVTPTHFNVLLDDIKLGPDKVQRLTYKLCHMYYNWQGTVRVPAPCQYAHKLAFLVGQSFSDKEPRIELCNKLFYL